jgi:hypothetical protein
MPQSLRDILDIKTTGEWLGAMLAAVIPEIYTGIKIPTNPADRDCQVLGAKALKTGNWTDLVNGCFR